MTNRRGGEQTVALVGFKVGRQRPEPNTPDEVTLFYLSEHPDALTLAEKQRSEWNAENRAAFEANQKEPDCTPVPGEPYLLPLFDEAEDKALYADKDKPGLGRPIPKGETKREPVRGRTSSGYRHSANREQRRPYD